MKTAHVLSFALAALAASQTGCDQGATRSCETLGATTICSDGPVTEDSACVAVDPWTIDCTTDPSTLSEAELALTSAPSLLLGPTSGAIKLTAPTGSTGTTSGSTSTGTSTGTTVQPPTSSTTTTSGTGSSSPTSTSSGDQPKTATNTTLSSDPSKDPAGGILGSGTVSDTVCIEEFPLCAPGWNETTMGTCCHSDGTGCGCKVLVTPSGGICATAKHPGGVCEQCSTASLACGNACLAKGYRTESSKQSLQAGYTSTTCTSTSGTPDLCIQKPLGDGGKWTVTTPINIQDPVVQDPGTVDWAACWQDTAVMATSACVEAKTTCAICHECYPPEGDCSDLKESLCIFRVAGCFFPPSPATAICVGFLAPQCLGCWSQVIDSGF